MLSRGAIYQLKQAGFTPAQLKEAARDYSLSEQRNEILFVRMLIRSLGQTNHLGYSDLIHWTPPASLVSFFEGKGFSAQFITTEATNWILGIALGEIHVIKLTKSFSSWFHKKHLGEFRRVEGFVADENLVSHSRDHFASAEVFELAKAELRLEWLERGKKHISMWKRLLEEKNP